jgi:2'-5' RNA ligase
VALSAEETALLVPFPELETKLAAHRVLDPSASFGLPPHITLLYPFAPIGELDEASRSRLTVLFANAEPIRVEFAETAWFGDDVVWLAPEPAEPFVALTKAIFRLFPDYPPFRGAFDSIVPHVTIGDNTVGAGRATSLAALKAAEAAVSAVLPLSAVADRVLLMAGERRPDGWRVVSEFALKAPSWWP